MERRMFKRVLVGLFVAWAVIVAWGEYNSSEADLAIKDSNEVYKETSAHTPLIFLPAKQHADGSVETLNRQIDEQIFCLARNIYWEARNQSKLGMIAVGRVVINRVNSNRHPNTICEVVHEGPTRESWKTKKNKNLVDKDREFYPIKNRCQFSWYCDGANDEVRRGEEAIYELSSSIARNIVLHNKWAGIVEGATHYHANYVDPNWSDKDKLTVRIDDHLFFKLW